MHDLIVDYQCSIIHYFYVVCNVPGKSHRELFVDCSETPARHYIVYNNLNLVNCKLFTNTYAPEEHAISSDHLFAHHLLGYQYNYIVELKYPINCYFHII